MKNNKLLLFVVFWLVMIFPCACSQGNVVSEENTTVETTEYENPVKDWKNMTLTGHEALMFAEQFSIDYYDNYALLTLVGEERYIIVPEKEDVPLNLDSDIVVLQQPISNAYLAATSAMDLIREIGAIDNLSYVGTNKDGWYIEAAKQAMDDGKLTYAGKYSAPDMEMLVEGDCDLAIESTMIFHNPEIKEQLETLDIPVIVERSSYESHPLGRLEWIKVYGLLFGKQDVANAYFEEQAKKLADIGSDVSYDANVVFFYVTNNGSVSVKKSSDYIAKMIQLAGGDVIAWDEEEKEDNAMSSMTIQMEAFYAEGYDADYLIYNSSIDDEIHTMQELLDKSPLFADFTAVKENKVWCTGKNMFQESTGVGDMIVDIHKILENPDVSDEELTYLHRVCW